MFRCPLVIQVDHGPLARLLTDLLAGFSGDGDPDAPAIRLAFRRQDGGLWVATPEGASTLLPSQALVVALGVVNRIASEVGPGLLVHGAAIYDGARAVVVPGASGAGKSTLAVRLVRAGFGYLSDEIASITLPSGRMSAYAKPITLKRSARRLVPEVLPSAPSGVDGLFDDAWFIAPQWLHPRALEQPEPSPTLAAVLVPHRHDGPTTLRALPRSEAAAALLRNSFNFLAHGGAWLPPLATCLREVRCHELRIGHEPDVDDRLVSLVREALA